MGLAPYGEPLYADLIREKLITVADDGSFQLDMSYFNYATGLTMTNKKFDALFGGLPRTSEAELTQREMDLAASVQKVTEDIVLKLAKSIAKETGERNLCLAGGVALNCVANGILLREKIFDNIWIQPAAGDAGGALGAALSTWYLHHNKERTASKEGDEMKGSYLGPKFTDAEIEAELNACGAKFIKLSEIELIEEIAKALADEKVIGWMQGRMEFGPRALGARSIIADPRSPFMQKQLNLKVKYRESFRPFAPSILREDVAEWFEFNSDSPYMLIVADIKKDKRHTMTPDEEALFGIDKLNVPRSSVPAITHVDYSARIQTVHADTNPRYHAVISSFKEKTGCPLVVNTSFNVRGEPIICTQTDAFKCFMGTEMDVLAIGNYVLYKEHQDKALKENYKERYDFD
jgi:carbamoyltransferase